MAIIGAIAIAAVGVFLAFYADDPFLAAGESYSAGDFTVRVVEDTSSRFLATVENNGPTLNNAAAFGVKKGLNEHCEPQGIVVANFDVRDEDGRAVPDPDSIPGDSSVTLDSRESNLNAIPTGPDFETSVYVLGLEPESFRAKELIQKIPIQQLNSSELELFEGCIDEVYDGYPLQLKLQNIRPDTQVYISLDDGSAIYETALNVRSEAQDLSTVFWPASRNDWLTANYTQAAGPAPAWGDTGRVLVSVSVVSREGQVFTFEDSVMPRLVTTSLEFFELAKGDPVPIYPRYWEIQVDLVNGTLG